VYTTRCTSRSTVFFGLRKKRKKNQAPLVQKKSGGPVYVDSRKYVVSFKEKRWKIELTASQIRQFLFKFMYRGGIAAVLIVAIIVSTSSHQTEAQVAAFNAQSCLGSWQNPTLAEGAADVFDGSSEIYNSSNSAYNPGSQGDMFCGGFEGDIPADTTVSIAILSFSLYAGDVIVREDGVIEAAGTIGVEPIPQELPPQVSIDAAATSGEQMLEGDDFESHAGAILDAPGDNVSFTLTEGDATSSEEHVTIVSGDNFASSAVDILDAPDDAHTVVIYDDTQEDDIEEDSPIEGDVVDNFYEILDVEDGGSVQVTFPEEGEEEQTQEDVTPAETQEQETVSLIDTVLKHVFGSVKKAIATTSPEVEDFLEEEVVVDDIENDLTSSEENAAQEEDASSSENTILDEGVTEELEQDITTEDSEVVVQEEEDVVVEPAATTSDDEIAQDTPNTLQVEPVVIEVQPSDHLLTVEYTFNGVDWLTVGQITRSNWQNVSFGLPVSDWNELETLQIRLVSPGDQIEAVPIFLDAVTVEVGYKAAVDPKPVIEMIDSHRSLKPGEELQFDFSYREANRGTQPRMIDRVREFVAGKEYDRDFLVPRTTIISSRGERVDIEPIIERGPDDTWQVRVQPDGRMLHPGKYTIEVEVQDGNETVLQQQTFYWGVLTINTNKSMFEPYEQAYIQMGVLDDNGRTICDAELELVIIDPGGNNTTLSTADETILYSGECAGDSYVEVPDYFAYYDVADVGEYVMTLKNLNTEYETTDSFEVRSNVPFVVERTGPTRIFPPATYEMKINIEARQDFEGLIYEYIPEGFLVLDTQSRVVVGGERDERTMSLAHVKTSTSSTNDFEGSDVGTTSVTTLPLRIPTFEYLGQGTSTEVGTIELAWDAMLNRGDKIEFSYIFDAPDVSPELFLLGPLEFYQ
jgi:hypothetical protein